LNICDSALLSIQRKSDGTIIGFQIAEAQTVLSDEEVTLCKIVYDHVISVQQPQQTLNGGTWQPDYPAVPTWGQR
jgi:hypothetical protein